MRSPARPLNPARLKAASLVVRSSMGRSLQVERARPCPGKGCASKLICRGTRQDARRLHCRSIHLRGYGTAGSPPPNNWKYRVDRETEVRIVGSPLI